jgi:hypothetical protein
MHFTKYRSQLFFFRVNQIDIAFDISYPVMTFDQRGAQTQAPVTGYTYASCVSNFQLINNGITRQCYPMHQEQRNQHLKT